MALDPEEMSCEGADVGNVDEIGLLWRDGDFEILGVVHEGGLGDRFCASGILDINELLDELLNGLVIPVGEGEDEFFVIFALIRTAGVVNDDGAPEAFRVLAVVMCVVPVCPCLLDLFK